MPLTARTGASNDANRLVGPSTATEVGDHLAHDVPGADDTPAHRAHAWSRRFRDAGVLAGKEPGEKVGHAAVEAGHKVRYFTAADLVETLYRALADNSVGRVIETLLRNDAIIIDEVAFAPLDDTGTQLLFRFVAAAYERRSLAIASHWSFEDWGRFLPELVAAVSILDRLLHHATVVVTGGDSYRMRQSRQPRGGHPISLALSCR